jgi:hypothetical protein
VAGPEPTVVKPNILTSQLGNGLETVLHFQELGGERYLDTAGLVRSDAGDIEAECRQ